MLIFNEKNRLETEKTEELILNKLKEEVIAGNVNMMIKEHNVLYKRNKEYFIGKIEKDKFLLTRMYSTGRNVFSPIIVGKVIKEEKTIINMVFKTQLVVKVFLIFLLIFALYNLIGGIFENSKDIFHILSIAIAVMTVYVAYLLYFCKQVKEIKKFLEKLWFD